MTLLFFQHKNSHGHHVLIVVGRKLKMNMVFLFSFVRMCWVWIR